MKNILLLTLSISALLIPTNLLMGKRNKKAESLPLVDVSVPLHIERNQFGLPIAIGTPLPGPKHGIGSYWYQVGKMWAEADAQDNFAVVVYRYLENAGRLAEFIGDQGESSDIFSRRISMTTAQYEQQLVSELAAGAYPEEIIDFLNGVHQGYINHITKIENGDAPLPADFVTDIGILNWFWAERTTVAPTLFTIPNYIRGLEILNYDFGSSYTSVNQVFFGFLGQLAASEADPSGGVDAVNVLNDINGVPSFNFRYTVKEGDRGGIYCPTMASGLCIQTPDGALRKAKQSHQPRAILPLQKSHLTRLKKELEAKKTAPYNTTSSHLRFSCCRKRSDKRFIQLDVWQPSGKYRI